MHQRIRINFFSIMESTRQQKVARLLQKDLAGYFQRNAAKFLGKMISVTTVRVSPDLSFAKVFISVFPTQDRDDALAAVRAGASETRFEMGKLMRHQLRKIPEFAFEIDDSLDYIDNINNLLKK